MEESYDHLISLFSCFSLYGSFVFLFSINFDFSAFFEAWNLGFNCFANVAGFRFSRVSMFLLHERQVSTSVFAIFVCLSCLFLRFQEV